MKGIFKRINFLPRWLVIIMDLTVLTFGLVMSGFLAFDLSTTAVVELLMSKVYLIYLITYLFAIITFEAHTGIIRYTQKKDAFRLLKSILAANLLLAFLEIVYFISYAGFLFPLSVFGISFFLNIGLLIGYRIFIKELFHYSITSMTSRRHVVVYGAGTTGRMTANLLEDNFQSGYEVMGFFDDNKKLTNTRVYGKTILPPDKDLGNIKEFGPVDELIIAIGRVNPSKKKWIIEECLKRSITVREVPAMEKWVGGILSVKQIKDVKVEDLLGRQEINVASGNAVEAFSGKVIMVTGAAGSIGAEICNQVMNCGVLKLILLDQAESGLYDLHNDLKSKFLTPDVLEIVLCDVTNESGMFQTFKKFKPDVVFHAAAYKHVPIMENQPFEAANTNILGTRIVSNLAVEFDVKKFVFISTDKAVNPTNIMGASKRAAEIYIQALSYSSSTEFITTRFGNVLGSNGSVIPLFKKQIKDGGPIRVTHPEITRFFMTIPEACSLVLEAGAMGNGGEIFVFDMGEPVKILDLAKKMIKLAGLEMGKDIDIEFSGLRPGEKLYEEVLAANENTKATHHPKIMIAGVRKHDFERVNLLILSIRASLEERNEFEMVRKLKNLVPEFKSTVSRFEVLDK